MHRVSRWLAGLIGAAMLVMLATVLTHSDSNNAKLTRFEQASYCEEASIPVPLSDEGIGRMIDQPPATRAACWQSVYLPDNHPSRDFKVNTQTPELRRIWYRVWFNVPADWDTVKPLMIYVPRIMAHAWQIMLDGQAIADNRFDWRATWNSPVGIPFYVEKNQLNTVIDIQIGIIATAAEGFSIARITVGEANVIRNLKSKREYFQITLPQASSAVMIMLGFFFFTFWLSRRTETEYLIMVFVSIAFCIINLRFTFMRPDDANLDAWYKAIIHDIVVPWIIWLVYLFIGRFAEYSSRWLERLLWFYAMSMTIFSLPNVIPDQDYTLLKVAIYTLVGTGTVVNIAWLAHTSKKHDLYVMVAVLSFGAFTPFNDLMLASGRFNPEFIYMLPYGELTVFIGFLYSIQRRYNAAIVGQERLNLDLGQQLAEREKLTKKLTASEAELRAQQQRLLELERAQALADERQRLMHDMHDGLGSSLLTTLAAIERSNLPQQAVADALRTCIEDLRLVIDSLEPTANDLATLLGTIRYRLGQRLDSAGLELLWEINDLPPLPWLEPPDALNVLRLVQEALVNVLKHARASQVRVSTRSTPDYVEIQIVDNGQGYDPDTVTPGRGSHSQRKRAEKLGGELEIVSKDGDGTSLRLRLPIVKYHDEKILLPGK